MDKDTYLILRVTGSERVAFDPLSPFGLRSDGSLESTGSASAIEYQVDAQQLDAKDYADVRRDPTTAAMARPMPLQLIEPVADGGHPHSPKPSTTPPGGSLSPGHSRALTSAMV